ncbi:hypothetical protein [Embleya hyalina]|uniref:Circularly permuted type 2 ATP-grasp protein n=1 Tax=Embleya hyalina TaxID=516124 RepID=A0A401Z1N1_9ACTN|nr:hypothetical protein [Embleya hyalina]GCE00789.1 hypothetical protein EHYA_08515 [Embleya hyalina]
MDSVTGEAPGGVTGETVDDVTAEYVRRCRVDARLRTAMSAAALSPSFRAAFGGRLTPRPFFAARHTMDTLAADLNGVFDLIVSLPERLFDGDLDAYCAAVGIDDRRAALIRRLRSVEPARSGRADLYHDGSCFRLLEFNIGGTLGGSDLAEVPRALMTVRPFVAFAEEFGLGYVDSARERATTLRRAAAPVAGGREPVVAAVEADGWLSANRELFASLRESMERCGVRFMLGELGGLRRRGNRLFLDGTRVDLILRYFVVDQILDDPAGRAAYEMICRVHEEGGVVLHTTLESHLHNDKAALALLSDPTHRDSFSDEERRSTDRLLPWTRALCAGPTDVDGRTVDLADFCVEHRESLILKPNAGYSGIGIVPGWERDDREWAALLRHSVEGPFVVQRRVAPVPQPVVDPITGDLEHLLPTWGVFVSADGYAGGMMRSAPIGGGAVINFSSGPGTSVTGLFTHPGRDSG